MIITLIPLQNSVDRYRPKIVLIATSTKQAPLSPPGIVGLLYLPFIFTSTRDWDNLFRRHKVKMEKTEKGC